MTNGYILIAAIFLLGGLIAILGDRLGTKIGKARLRLFNLRPRQTAMIITFITGILVSASTWGILLGLSESLRRGIFQLDDILKELRNTQQELTQVNKEKKQVATQLEVVKEKQTTAIQKLSKINLDFKQSKEQLKNISQQANRLRSELNVLLDERARQVKQLEGLKQQSAGLQSQLKQREARIAIQDRVLQEKETRLSSLEQQQQILQTEIQQRDKFISSLDSAISTKDRNLKIKQNQLTVLESQLKFLNQEVANLEQYYQTYQELRERRIALVKGQVLASAVVRIVEPMATKSAIDRLLRQANSNAIKAILFKADTPEQRVVKITEAQVQQLANQLKDGQDYVLRILSAGNYVQGEREVRVFADLAINKQVFPAGEEIATVSIDSRQADRNEVRERLNWLLAVSRFRAQRAGIVGDLQIGDGQLSTLIQFVDKIAQSEQPLNEIKAVVSETTYTAGPLKIDFVVLQNGKIIFST